MRFELPVAARIGLSADMVSRSTQPREDTLIVAVTYRCNSRCTFCIIGREIDDGLADLDLAAFETVCGQIAVERRFRRLTLTGAEATLRSDLAALARMAVERGGFEVVRIQTNARRLADRALCQALFTAGVREYFVSVHAHEPELDARITRAPRGFGEMCAGLANLQDIGAYVVTNTVVCADNAGVLPEIADFLVARGVDEAHFWSFLRIGDAPQAPQLVRLRDSLGPLREALDRCRAGGLPTTLKWFPRCLLGDHAASLDNHQPQMLIRDEFQARLSQGFRFGCVHAARCRWFGRGCDGLHEGYVAAFGDEGDLLRPEPG